MFEKIVSSARKCTSVPRFSVSPETVKSIGEMSYVLPCASVCDSTTRFCTKPFANSMKCILPSRLTVNRSHLLSALTQDTPTPCSPPDTL